MAKLSEEKRAQATSLLRAGSTASRVSRIVGLQYATAARLRDELGLESPGRGWRGNAEGHRRAGKLGGSKVAQDRAHMAEIGRKGGNSIARDRAHMAEIGRRGGRKIGQDRAYMAEIGRKGGQSK